MLRSINLTLLDQRKERFSAAFDFVGRRANLIGGCRRLCVVKRSGWFSCS